jgi:hypothetical protein
MNPESVITIVPESLSARSGIRTNVINCPGMRGFGVGAGCGKDGAGGVESLLDEALDLGSKGNVVCGRGGTGSVDRCAG